jgi:transglutaminase-like putative cysteine protease
VGGFAVGAAAANGAAAILADAFAFRAFGRAEAAVPSGVLFVFAAALGADTNRVQLTAAWLAAALALIAVLRASHAQTDGHWIGRRTRVVASVVPLTLVLAGTAALGGALVGPRLPGAGADALLETKAGSGSTEVLSPLVDIRSRLVSLSNTLLFTVQANEARYWRVTGLMDFDGTTWSLVDETLEDVSGTFARPGAATRDVTQDYAVSSLGGHLLPAAFPAVSVDRGGVSWGALSGSLVVSGGDGLKRGDRYGVVSEVIDVSPGQLRAATSLTPPSPVALQLPADFPSDVASIARQVTAGATTTYDKALALQNWFRSEFTYDLAVQAGHGNNALRNFLQNRRGYCEQFSGAFAAMARSLGIPARVAVGYTTGDLYPDGQFHVFGRNAHAWPEVWFDGIGWVSFEPTPGRGEPGAEERTGVAPAQAVAPGLGGGGGTEPTETTVPAPAEPTESTTPASTVAPDPNAPETAPPFVDDPFLVGGGSGPTPTATGGGGAPVGTIALVVLVLGTLYVAFMPRAMKAVRTRRRRGTAVEQIVHNWQSCADALATIGLGPHTGETPLEHATRVERASGIDGRALHDLAYAATAAAYGRLGDESMARRTRALSVTVVQAVRQRVEVRTLIAARFDPRLALRLTV